MAKRTKENAYRSMKTLLEKEDARSYTFDIRDTASPVAILAPHGGLIEWGTDQIAAGIAAEGHRLFCFKGRRIGGDNYDNLHVKSYLYDEPQCNALVKACNLVVAIHGCHDVPGKDNVIYVGGSNKTLREEISDELNSAGFPTEPFATTPEDYRGVDARNICNLGNNRDGGAQLEIALALRNELVPPRSAQRGVRFQSFVDAVKRGIHNTLYPPH